MNFFAQQETARQHTLRLLFLFLAAVVAVVLAVDLTVSLGAWYLDVHDLGLAFHEGLDGFVLAAIAVFAIRRLWKLRGGGEAVAKMVSAREVRRDTTDLDERRLLNVVDEMAIASGLTVPSVWIMDKEEGINAFAAGYSPNRAVIVVTHGTLTKLNREELQGVVGHEFGHILNGDMRLNVRLIGILAGIVIVGEAGLVVIKLGAEANDTGALPFIIWGAFLAGVGYIGVFFGRMIKAAVAREREFLADASSVQFTRNPEGLASALDKIRKEGTIVANAFAGEMSHMYFGQAIKPKVFSDWFATHPPVEERIARITGRRVEPVAAPASVSEEDPAGSLLSQVGRSSADHVEHVVRMIGGFPEPLRRSLDTIDGARRLVYGYLFGGDAAVRAIQVKAMIDAGDGALAANLADYVKGLRALGASARLPLLTLSAASLKQMDVPARAVLLRTVDALIDADHEVTLDEFVIRTILRRQLAADTSRGERVRYKTLEPVAADAALVIATLARAGSLDPAAQQAAYARGAARVGVSGAMKPQPKLAAGEVTAALERLRLVAPLAKPPIIVACVETALADGKLMVAELELLRAVGMTLDCPLPPSIEQQAVGGDQWGQSRANASAVTTA